MQHLQRQPKPLKELQGGRHTVNAQLRVLGEPEMQEAEMLAARLYTGPMFIKALARELSPRDSHCGLAAHPTG